MNDLLENLIKNNLGKTKLGEVASYIPELDKAKKEDLGICIFDVEGNFCYAGDYQKKFTVFRELHSACKEVTFFFKHYVQILFVSFLQIPFMTLKTVFFNSAFCVYFQSSTSIIITSVIN